MKIIFCILFFTCVLSTSAKNLPSYTDSASVLLTSIPFTELYGGIIIVRIQIDQYPDSLNFIFDTGNSGISLDSAVAAKLGFTTQTSDKIIKGVTGNRKAVYSYNHFIHLAQLKVEHLHFHVLDYEQLSGVYGLSIDGIIGYSFFERYIININYDNHKIEVYQPGNFHYPRGGFYIQPEFSIFPINNLYIEDLQAMNIKTIFDIGAGLNLLLSTKYENQLWAPSKISKKFETQIEGLGGRKTVELKVLKKIKIGPYTFRKVPLHLFNDENDILHYPTMGGILGNDLLRRFNIILNYPEGKFYLVPNKNINEPFDYTYSGLSVAQDSKAITIVDIINDSPAANASLQVGDQIFYIDGQFVNNVQQFNIFFRNTFRKVKLGIIRGNVVIEKTLVLKDIRKK